MFGYDSLKGYFETNFTLMHEHKYSLTELENMVPWERRTYIAMFSAYMKEKNEQLKMALMQRKR
jgi:3-methyladenine DNA glycosylase AlkD